MKNLLLLFIVISLSSNAQVYTDKIESEWGEKLKLGKKALLEEVIGSDESGFYTLITKGGFSLGGQKMQFMHFDDNLSLINEEDLELPREYKDYNYSSIVFFAKNIYVLARSYNKRDKTTDYKAFRVNKKTLLIDGPPIDLATLKGESRKNTGDVNYAISEGNTTLAFRIEYPYIEGETDRFLFKVFDEEFNIIWENEFENELKGEEGVFNPTGYMIVDNEGNIFSHETFISDISSASELSTRDFRKMSRNDEIEYQSYLNIYYKNGDQPISTPLAFEDFNVQRFVITPLKDGRVAITGLHSGDKEYGGAAGAFYAEIDPVQEDIDNVNDHTFTEGFITQHWSHKQKKRNEKKNKKRAKRGKEPVKPELYDYKIREVFQKENGDMCMIAEQFFIRVVTSTHTGSNGATYTTTTYYYYYKDLIVINYDKSGKITWVKNIPKRQVSTNDGGRYLSYYAFTENDKLYIVFNDNAKNLNVDSNPVVNEKNDIEWLKWKDAVCALVTVNEKGKVEREWMFNLKDEKVIAVPKASGPLDKREHLLFTQKGKNSKFVKFRLD